jgi:2-iminobutanoate/2-iminopropanoate deaminase
MPERRSIEITEKPMHGGNPFPAAVKVGNMVYSSAVSGVDRKTGEMPEGVEDQIANVFDNMKAILAEAGGGPENVASCKVYLEDRDQRPLVNKVWVELFPDEKSRPVRHTIGGALPGAYKIQIEFTAVLD